MQSRYCLIFRGGLGNIVATIDQINDFSKHADHVFFSAESRIMSDLVKFLLSSRVTETSLHACKVKRCHLVILNEMSLYDLMQCLFAKKVFVLQTKYSSNRSKMLAAMMALLPSWEVFFSSCDYYPDAVGQFLARISKQSFIERSRSSDVSMFRASDAIKDVIANTAKKRDKLELIVHLGSSQFGASKRASIELFGEVIDHLDNALEFDAIISIEGPEEIGLTDHLMNQSPRFAQKIKVVQPSNFSALNRVFRGRHQIFLGNDSFVAHYASHFEIPAIVFFKPLAFRRFHHQSPFTFHIKVEIDD